MFQLTSDSHFLSLFNTVPSPQISHLQNNILTCLLDTPGSNLGPSTSYPTEASCGFPKCL